MDQFNFTILMVFIYVAHNDPIGFDNDIAQSHHINSKVVS